MIAIRNDDLFSVSTHTRVHNNQMDRSEGKITEGLINHKSATNDIMSRDIMRNINEPDGWNLLKQNSFHGSDKIITTTKISRQCNDRV